MKRIQRETLSDVRKFKEKHDEIEHILSLYKTGKGLELLDLPIQVKIALDATGALFLVGDDDNGNEFERARADLDKAGRRTGLRSRFVFESKTRGKADTIAAELSTQLGASAGHHLGRPVELTRLQYSARVNRWLSLTLVPFGARCTNFLHSSSMIQNLRTQASLDGPPSTFEHHDCGAGLRIQGSKLTASLAGLILGSGGQDSGGGGGGTTNRVTTFGQVTCRPANDVKLSLSGLWQVHSPSSSSSSRLNHVGILAIPRGRLRPEHPAAGGGTEGHTELSVKFDNRAGGAMALMVDCELYETLKTEGWVQMDRSRPSSHGPLRWGFSLSDVPDNELGWGVKVSGGTAGETTTATTRGRGRSQLQQQQHQHLELEGFLNFNLGKGARLQPALVYARTESTATPALFLRSSWVM